jgi:hypothetical protein
MFWNLGVWKRVLTNDVVTTDVFVGCSLFVPPDLMLICGDDGSCVTKSFLYSGSLAAVSMVGRTLLWCVAG